MTLKQTITIFIISSLMLQPSLNAASVAIGQTELVSVDLPEHKVEQTPIHFSQALSQNTPLSFTPKGYTSLSDEYWQEVSGKELNAGITLYTTQPEALIRLSGKRGNIADLTDNLSVDPKYIELRKDKQKLMNPFSRKVSQQQFATANIFPNSSAVKLDKSVGKGKFQLKVNQSLNANQRYVINVKEKGSEHQLKVNIQKQSYFFNDVIEVDTFMSSAKGALAAKQQTFTIKTPNDTMLPVRFNKIDGKYGIDLSELQDVEQPGKLYELHIASQANDNGLMVRRNGKVAFAIAQPTAKMTGPVSVSKTHALVDLDIASEGRYEISGVVSGVNSLGKVEPVMLSRSAYYLEPGKQSVELKFDMSILLRSSVTPPFTVTQLRLVDQSRLALLQQNK